jgi:two-component system OmpR family response regulator
MNYESKIKVFLVDDDPMFIQSLRHTLHKDWAEIKTFPTGEDCLKNLKQENPDVVVMDYYLNDKTNSAMNGMQALSRIKKSCPDTEVIMLSAHNNMAIAADSMRQGAYDYIHKGQSAFNKVKYDLEHISKSHEKTDAYNKKIDHIKIINIAIIAVLIIIFILNRMF